MDINKIHISAGVKKDPLEDGFFPICFVGTDARYDLDYWLVGDSDDLWPKEIAELLIGIIEENKNLRKELRAEKDRTNMLNFGQGEKG